VAEGVWTEEADTGKLLDSSGSATSCATPAFPLPPALVPLPLLAPVPVPFTPPPVLPLLPVSPSPPEEVDDEADVDEGAVCDPLGSFPPLRAALAVIVCVPCEPDAGSPTCASPQLESTTETGPSRTAAHPTVTSARRGDLTVHRLASGPFSLCRWRIQPSSCRNATYVCVQCLFPVPVHARLFRSTSTQIANLNRCPTRPRLWTSPAIHARTRP
jgi:hypothetical protein